MSLEIVTAEERPDLAAQTRSALRERWPEFIFHDQVTKRYLDRVERYYAAYDITLLLDGHVAAGGWGVTFAWDGTVDGLPSGYDGALVQSVEDHEAGSTPTAFSFMAAAVRRDVNRAGLAREVLTVLAERARDNGVEHILAPIRPTLKHRYPIFGMAEYATWTRPDGASIDPWIRTHQRMGARILGVAADSMVIRGTVCEWEEWTGMQFPVSGDYVVPEALNLLHVDRDADDAVYREENLWMQHS